MSKIKDLPLLERPREKFIHYGVEKLSDEDLLAIILGTGYQGKNAKELAHEILSSVNGISGLFGLTYNSLLSYKGVSKVKALKLSSIFELCKRVVIANSDENTPIFDETNLINKYKSYLKDINQELVIVICLNKNKKILHEETLYKGSQNNVSTSIKEIIRVLLDYNSKSFYLIHNHPSGQTSPSMDDVILTENLILKARHLGIKMLGHIIFGKDDYFILNNNN